MKAIYSKQVPTALVKGKWTYETIEFEVRIMAQAENYAMVRRKGCMPFVARARDLRPVGKSPAYRGGQATGR